VNRSARRRAQRATRAALVEAATYVPRPRRSHYQTADIRDAVQADLAAMRAQMHAQRDRPRHKDWAFNERTAKAERVAAALPV
jgi:hypothetical protein